MATTPSAIVSAVRSSGDSVFKYWSQSETEIYKDVGSGICEGMCLDWLRRKFMGKRDFADCAKYDPANKVGGLFGFFQDPNPKLATLEAKQKALHAAYASARIANSDLMIALSALSNDGVKREKQDPVQQFALAYNATKSKATGFEKLTYTAVGKKYLDSSNMADAKRDLGTFLDDAVDGIDLVRTSSHRTAGLLINFEGARNHTIAYNRDLVNPFAYQVLDPNAGEFQFRLKTGLLTFLADWWAAAYSSKPRIELEMITYRP